MHPLARCAHNLGDLFADRHRLAGDEAGRGYSGDCVSAAGGDREGAADAARLLRTGRAGGVQQLGPRPSPVPSPRNPYIILMRHYFVCRISMQISMCDIKYNIALAFEYSAAQVQAGGHGRARRQGHDEADALHQGVHRPGPS